MTRLSESGSTVGLLAFGLTLALMAWGSRARARDTDAYLVAGRQVGLLPLIATLVMTEFNTATLVAFAAAGYAAGPMAIGLPLVFLVGLAWYTLTVARPWQQLGALSVSELFSRRYGATLGRLSAALLILAMLGFCATYVKSITLLVAPWVGLPPSGVLAAVLCGLMLAMTWGGGLLSVIRADVLSFGLTLVALPVLLIRGLALTGAEPAAWLDQLGAAFPPEQRWIAPIAQWNHPALPFRFVFSLIVLTMFTYICSPWYGQKLFAARSARVARWGVGISAVLVFVLYAVVVLASAVLRQHTQVPPEQALGTLLRTGLPTWAGGLLLAVLFAAAMTTLTGVWSTITAMIAADFGWAPTLRSQRAWCAGIAFTSWLGSQVFVDRILDRLILANIPILALSFALLAGFYWPRAGARAAWASVAVGVAWGVGCLLVVGEPGYLWPWVMGGIPLVFGVGILFTILAPRAPT